MSHGKDVHPAPDAEATSMDLPALVSWLRTAVPPGASITLTLGDPTNPVRTLTHDARGQALDGAQWQAEQGPVLSAFTSGVITTSADLVSDRRWPYLQLALASETPVSALAAPISHERPDGPQRVGVLGAYSDTPHAFSDKDVRAQASLAASAAALIIAACDRAERAEANATGLQEAMASRAVIEQAKGIAAVHLGIGTEEAFVVMSRVSQDHNIKLVRCAQVLVDSPNDQKMAALLRQSAQRCGLLTR